jgi:CLIP-associating protein 1/2
MSNTLSNPERIQGEIVEDALRARAEQAESAAERLLELVEPEENGNHHSTIPASLLLGSNGDVTPKPYPDATPGPAKRTRTLPPPVTPLNRNATIFRQASLFKNSPAYNGTGPSLLDVLKDRKNETSWWLKRMNSA